MPRGYAGRSVVLITSISPSHRRSPDHALAGERTFRGGAGAFVFAPQGLEHTYWNEGQTPSKMLITISPPGFERYFEELAEGLEAAGDDEQAALRVRKALSEKYDIEVVGPPRQATD